MRPWARILITTAGALGLAGCTFVEPEPEPAPPEPVIAPQDPAEPGAPVGVRTVTFEGETLEVWYPTLDVLATAAGADLPVDAFVPTSVTDLLGDIGLPAIPSVAVRDAPPRPVPEPLPVLLFSHGFGGFRTQSASLCAHLASRGYVVVSPDHPGRMLGDVLPCVFDPPLDGCDFSGIGGDDVAIDDLLAARRWVEGAAGDAGSFLVGLADASSIGIFGHSAGGGSSMELGGLDPKISAILAMAAGASTDADKPAAVMGGQCDAFAAPPAMEGALDALVNGTWINVLDSGHMPFSDICGLDLGGLADDLLVDRPDVDPLFLDQLLGLATSGCPGYVPADDPPCGTSYLPLDQSQRIIRHFATRFFDRALKGQGEPLGSVPEDGLDAVEVRP
jgi:acetyl esterase/lipase